MTLPICATSSTADAVPLLLQEKAFKTLIRPSVRTGGTSLLRCPSNVLGAHAFVLRRPLPLAQLPVSATGGGRIAPPQGKALGRKKGLQTQPLPWVIQLVSARTTDLSHALLIYQFKAHKYQALSAFRMPGDQFRTV